MLLGTALTGCEVLYALHAQPATPIAGRVDGITLCQLLDTRSYERPVRIR